MQKNIMYCVVLLVGFMIAATTTAQVITIPTPQLTVSQTNSGHAFLQWTVPSNVAGFGYRVFKSVDSLPFIKIAEVGHSSFVDHAVQQGKVYRYKVAAFNNLGEGPHSNVVTFRVGPPNPSTVARGFIKGTIIDDTTGLPLHGVRVRFFRSNGTNFFKEVYTNNQGYYFAPLDTGSFFVFATKWPFIPEWFDNSLTRANATPLLIALGDTGVANFGLTKPPPPPPPTLVSVNGTVIDSITNLPIANAFVAIMRTNSLVSTIQNHQGSNFFGMSDETFNLPGIGLMHGVVRVVKTDVNGNYIAQVPAGHSYIAVASKIGYIPEFYKDKRTPYLADRLLINADTTGINFDLLINPAVQNSLSGKIKNPENLGIPARVVLYHKTNRGMQPARSVVTDSLGNYIFNYIFAGTYYAKAIPLAAYTPAWYDVDSCGIIRWINADTIAVAGNVSNKNICVLPLTTPGFARVSGKIFTQTQTTGVQGVTVYAISTTTNMISGFDITETDGSFNLENLATGSYKIVADKEGFNSSYSPVHEVGTFNNYTVNNVFINITDGTLNVGDNNTTVPVTYFLDQNYPNPFNPSTEIKFGLPAISKINVSVYNILGQRIVSLYEGELSAGNHSLTWNGIDESGKVVGSGIYLYKITASSSENSTKFSSVKKMMLVK